MKYIILDEDSGSFLTSCNPFKWGGIELEYDYVVDAYVFDNKKLAERAKKEAAKYEFENSEGWTLKEIEDGMILLSIEKEVKAVKIK